MISSLRRQPKRPLTIAGLVLTLAVTVVGAAFAQVPADIVKDRKAVMENTGKALRVINTGLKDGGNLASLSEPASQIAGYAARVPSLYPAGTGPADGMDTKAKAEIWTDRATFDRLAAEYKASADKLVSVIAAGDAAGAQVATAALGESCGACHRNFRAR